MYRQATRLDIGILFCCLAQEGCARVERLWGLLPSGQSQKPLARWLQEVFRQ